MNIRKISINEFKKRRFERSYISVYIVIKPISVENEQEIKVKKLCVIYGFTALGARRIIAIGDNINDKEMVQNAGLGIIMDNGAPYIKELADVIVANNNEDGVAEAIEKYILN